MTIEQMAEDLGISKSTVSRALSGKGRIGEDTRKRVQDYARRTGFWKEEEAAELPNGTNRSANPNLGVVIPADALDASIPFFQECLLGICEAAALLNYDVLITRGTANDNASLERLVNSRKVDGIILTRSLENDRALKYLTDIGFPVGLVGTCDDDRVIQVDADNQGASESLTGMLIGQGYRKFALVVGDITYKVNRARYQGFCDACEQRGVETAKQLIYTGMTNSEMIDNLVSNMIAERVECIVCGDDVICTRIMSKLQAEGYRIPKDISIVSLYNSFSLECFSPAVTALNFSARQTGNMLARQMIDCLRGNEYSKKTMMSYDILFRRSTDQAYRSR